MQFFLVILGALLGSATAAPPTTPETQLEVTQISVYYETLCPDSRKFFLRQLVPAYSKLARYMDVELVPFGNANVSYPRHDNHPVFRCQHGPDECYGNRVQACVIEQLKNVEQSMRYIECMFAADDWKNTRQTAPECARRLDIDWARVTACSDGSEGERLLIANSLKTFNLNPEHTFIPWIVIDKKHTDDMQKGAETHLMRYLCDNYFHHEPKIPQCKEEALRQFQAEANAATPTVLSALTLLVAALLNRLFA